MTTTISVDGMSCDHCEQTVEASIEVVPGVTAVSVDRTTRTATVEGDVDTSALVTAVEDAGYEASA